MSETKQAARVPTVEMTRVLPFHRDKVFQAWIDPKMIALWFGPRGVEVSDVTLDARVGGEYCITMAPGSWIRGRYQEVSPPERLVFTWSHLEALDDGAKRETAQSLVTVEFRALDGATEVSLLHENLSSEAGRSGVTTGWAGSFERLSELLRSSPTLN